MEIVKSALVAHNHSPDVVQLVTGFGDTGAAMVTAPSVDKIIFTGSPAVGRMVMAGAAPTLKPVVLELGGKDPMIFVDDVELDKVIPWAMRGCFQNCGQNCCGVERVFVYESVHSEVVSRVVKVSVKFLQPPTYITTKLSLFPPSSRRRRSKRSVKEPRASPTPTQSIPSTAGRWS